MKPLALMLAITTAILCGVAVLLELRAIGARLERIEINTMKGN